MAGLLLVFFLLVWVMVAVVSWAKTIQQENDLVINLASRQHILIMHMTEEVHHLAYHPDDLQRHRASLQETAETFEETLWALATGGQAPYLPDQPADVPATQDPAIQAQLRQFDYTWDHFRGHLDVLMTTGPDQPDFTAATREVERLSATMQEADEVVRLYEVAARQKTSRLWWVQAAIIAGATGLLAGGFLLMRKSILHPLRVLGSVTERITYGDLNTPVQLGGPREIEAVAHSLETMRTQLKSSQEALSKQAKKLQGDVAQRQRELKIAFEFSQEVVTELDLDQLFSSITDRALTLMRASAARLCLTAPDDEGLDLVTLSGGSTIPPPCQQTAGRCLVAQVINPGQPSGAEMGCFECRLSQIPGGAQCVVAPLYLGERILGAMCVVRLGKERFDPDEDRAFTLLANSAAIAIANAYLVEAGRRHAEEIAILAERERLAADLHDNLAQTLSFLNFKAEQLRELLATDSSPEAKTELDRVQATLRQAYDQVRVALVDLRQPAPVAVVPAPDTASGRALAEELRACLGDFQQDCDLPADLTIVDPGALALPPTVRKQALYIVREALTNIRRHARAQHVWVRVECASERNEARFKVQDDGCGFDPTHIDQNKHFGLKIMQAWAERCGGRLEIDTAPGVGTKVVAYFPLNA